jgi:hypothetical protein
VPQEVALSVSNEHILVIDAILNAIEADPNAEEFHEPVDHEALELHDYMEVVKRPMDLKTLRRNYYRGVYNTFESFLRDMQLIWDNCKAYNFPGMYKLASSMERVAKREINKVLATNKLQHVTVPLPANLPPPMKRKRSSFKPGNNKPPVKKTTMPVEVSVDMKMEFIQKVQKLRSTATNNLVNFMA